MDLNTTQACRTAFKTLAAALLLGTTACSGSNPVRDTFAAVGAGPTIAQTPDFVRQSRPANLDYIPVGTTAGQRPTSAKTADEVKAVEAEMDAVRTRNEQAAQVARKAGETPAPKPVKLPASKAPQQPAASTTPQ